MGNKLPIRVVFKLVLVKIKTIFLNFLNYQLIF